MIVSIKVLIANCVLLNVLALGSSVNCEGPVSFTNGDVTITGPCPNNTVLLVAVGSSIQYRCDYTKNNADYLIYWYIPKLSETAFLAGTISEHNITIVDFVGHTTVSIAVKEQYLNKSLSIQCGLCSGNLNMIVNSICFTDRLSEGIISGAVKMVTHGPPRHLSSSIVSDGIVMFQWSRPLVSDDSIVFIYTVQLMGTTSSVILVFNTTNTYITLSRDNITDTCIEYTSWSVSVENSYNTTMTDGGNISVVFQNEPSFTSNLNITTTLLSCSSINRLELIFSVSSLQPLNTLDYDIWLNDTINISYYTKNNISSIEFMDQLVRIQIPSLINTTPDQLLSITITISNECGEDTMEDVLPVINVSSVKYCTMTSSSIATITVAYTSPSMNTQTRTDRSMSTSSGLMSTTPDIIIDTPPKMSLNQIYSGVGIGVGAVIIIIIIIIIVTLLVLFKKRKSGSVSFIVQDPLPNIAAGTNEIENDSPQENIQRETKDIYCKVGKPNTQPTNAPDTQPYLTPFDAQYQKASYEKVYI